MYLAQTVLIRRVIQNVGNKDEVKWHLSDSQNLRLNALLDNGVLSLTQYLKALPK